MNTVPAPTRRQGQPKQRPVHVWILLLLLLPSISVFGQRSRPASSQPSSEEIAGPIMSAEQIIQILQSEPLLLEELRGEIVLGLENGESAPNGQLTDAMLFSRLRDDEQTRAEFTRELRIRGLGSGDLSEAGPQLPEGVEAYSEEMPEIPTALPNVPRGKHADYADAQKKRSRGAVLSAPEQSGTAPHLNRTSPGRQDEAVRRPNPYKNVPALADLYRQLASKPSALERFGLQLFRTTNGNHAELPMDLPAGNDYVLGPGDGLSIDLWGSVSRRLQRVVDRSGRLALPEAGLVMVAGKTMGDARQLIEAALSEQFRNVRAELSLTRIRSIRVYVVGDVARPGPYDISSLSTVLNALYAAGGPTEGGSLRAIRHYRGKQLVGEVDLYDLLLKGVRSDMERLEAGDTILVPPVGAQVTVAGMVRRPAIYELGSERTLAEVMKLAGDVMVSGSLGKIDIERIEAHQRRTMLSFSSPENGDPAAFNQALTSFLVQDGDRITISPILPYSDKTVYLEGHVFRPGKHPYADGMTVSQLIRSYQDLLPEPAERGEIIRLTGPELRPVVMAFNLHDALNGNPVKLRPFDTVRILGRYESDPPSVFIHGEVLRPGEYPLADSMSAVELVRMAGGFKRSAYTQSADLSSYVVSEGSKVVIDHREVPIGDALAGVEDTDVRLKPGDVLTIRQLPGWQDIGGAISVRGEVSYPGTYGIQEGERLSSVLRRAGGFRPSAYPAGAVLERAQVREIEKKTRAALVHRIESAQPEHKGESGQEAAAVFAAFAQQQQQILSRLKSQPVTGRLVINVSEDIAKWENTPADLVVRPGDVLTIPKIPAFVLLHGQVNNPSAVAYTPKKRADWYLRRAGGVTSFGDKKAIFIVRADGSVIGRGSQSGWWGGNVLSTVLRPGDTVVVPEKIINPSPFWRTLLNTAQVSSSLAIAAAAIAK